MVTSISKWVGDSGTNAYTFSNPSSTDRSYCVPVSNALVQVTVETALIDGSGGADNAATSVTGSNKLSTSGSQPFTQYNLISTTNAEKVKFKITTTFTNSLTHTTTPFITITISCNSNYAISATSVSSTQYFTHGTSTGFALPTYTTA